MLVMASVHFCLPENVSLSLVLRASLAYSKLTVISVPLFGDVIFLSFLVLRSQLCVCEWPALSLWLLLFSSWFCFFSFTNSWSFSCLDTDFFLFILPGIHCTFSISYFTSSFLKILALIFLNIASTSVSLFFSPGNLIRQMLNLLTLCFQSEQVNFFQVFYFCLSVLHSG